MSIEELIASALVDLERVNSICRGQIVKINTWFGRVLEISGQQVKIQWLKQQDGKFVSWPKTRYWFSEEWVNINCISII